ncbi:hypothetical protein BV392_04205 [Rhodovulum sulfidophilum]|nr:hypothetical protein BV392_04205 [Rhodovulum sulfidophilum]
MFMVPDREVCGRDGLVGRLVREGTARGCGKDALRDTARPCESGGVYSPSGRKVSGRGQVGASSVGAGSASAMAAKGAARVGTTPRLSSFQTV